MKGYLLLLMPGIFVEDPKVKIHMFVQKNEDRKDGVETAAQQNECNNAGNKSLPFANSPKEK